MKSNSNYLRPSPPNYKKQCTQTFKYTASIILYTRFVSYFSFFLNSSFPEIPGSVKLTGFMILSSSSSVNRPSFRIRSRTDSPVASAFFAISAAGWYIVFRNQLCLQQIG